MIGDQWMRSLDVWLCMQSIYFFLHKQLLVYHDLYYSCLSVWPWEAHVFAPWAPWNTRGWTATPALLQVLAGCHSWWLMAHPNSSTFIRFSDFGLSWNASRLAWHSHTRRQLAQKKSLQWWLPLASRIPKFGGNCCTCTVPRRLQKVYRRNMYFATLGTPSWQDVDRRPTRGLSTNPRYPRRRTALFETVKVDVVWAPCIGSSDVTTARRAASWTSCPPQRCVPGCQSDPVSKLSSGQHHLIRLPHPWVPCRFEVVESLSQPRLHWVGHLALDRWRSRDFTWPQLATAEVSDSEAVTWNNDRSLMKQKIKFNLTCSGWVEAYCENGWQPHAAKQKKSVSILSDWGAFQQEEALCALFAHIPSDLRKESCRCLNMKCFHVFPNS